MSVVCATLVTPRDRKTRRVPSAHKFESVTDNFRASTSAANQVSSDRPAVLFFPVAEAFLV